VEAGFSKRLVRNEEAQGPFSSKRLEALCRREAAVFGRGGASARDEVFAALNRAFKAVDADILQQARDSNVIDCQFGGTTAVVALRIGHVRAAAAFLHLLTCMHACNRTP
jgi:hypothetical protein